MKTLTVIITTLTFVIVVCATAFAGADFRCGNTFAEAGKTHSAEILISCGEPKLKEDMGFKGKGVGKKLEKNIKNLNKRHYFYDTLYFLLPLWMNLAATHSQAKQRS